MPFPVLGALGALGGGLGVGALLHKKTRGNLSDFLFGSDKWKQQNAFSPQQMQLHQGMGSLLQNSGAYGQAFGNLQALLDPSNEGYNRFTQPYMDAFNNETLPMLAERFAGRGALSSSAFGQALGTAGAGLQNQLASLKAGLQNQAGSQIFGQYENFLGQKPYYNYLQQNQGFAGPAAVAGIQGYFGGR